MPHPISRWLAAALVVGGAGADAAPRPIVDRVYECRPVARTAEFPAGFTGYAMSASGTVAFGVSPPTPDGIAEIRVGRGDAGQDGVPISHAVARASTRPGGASGLSEFFGPPSIGDSGHIAFMAVPPDGWERLYEVSVNHNALVPPLPAFETRQTDPASIFVGFFSFPQIDAGGRFTFFASYRLPTTSQLSAFFRDSAVLWSPGATTNAFGEEAVAERGSGDGYAFTEYAGTFPDLETRLLRNGELADSVGGNGTINGLSIAGGRVAYFRFTDASTWRLLVTAGSNPAGERVDSTEDAVLATSSPTPQEVSSVNGYGDVAFQAIDAASSVQRVFVADGQRIDRVVCQNGIVPISIAPRSFNSDGEIAFRGAVNNGPFVIAVASPLAGLPTSCVGLADATPCADDDPETEATCSAGVCTGVPPDRPTSCLGLPDDTACDDGEPGTFAFCANDECVPAVPEPGAAASALGAIAALSCVATRGRSASRRSTARARRGTRADRRPARW